MAYCRVVLLSTAICFSHTQLIFNFLLTLMLLVIQLHWQLFLKRREIFHGPMVPKHVMNMRQSDDVYSCSDCALRLSVVWLADNCTIRAVSRRASRNQLLLPSTRTTCALGSALLPSSQEIQLLVLPVRIGESVELEFSIWNAVTLFCVNFEPLLRNY